MSNDAIARAMQSLPAISMEKASQAPVVPYTELLALLREADFFVSFPTAGANYPDEREKVARRIETALESMGVKPWFPHQGLGPLHRVPEATRSGSEAPAKRSPSPAMVDRVCDNRTCRSMFSARRADVARGWARFCSKSCKAQDQTRRQGDAHQELVRRARVHR